MEESKEPHNIFVINPVKLLSYVERFVKIVLQNGQIITGTVYTIDPVSQSVVLIKREPTRALTMKIVLNHSITSMEEMHDRPEEQKNVLNQYILRSGKNVDCEHLKEDVKNWLIKHMIPVIESGNKLIVDTLEIHPPYGPEQCFCSNAIVLSRIQNLLRQMPSTAK